METALTSRIVRGEFSQEKVPGKTRVQYCVCVGTERVEKAAETVYCGRLPAVSVRYRRVFKIRFDRTVAMMIFWRLFTCYKRYCSTVVWRRVTGRAKFAKWKPKIN